MTKMTGIAGMTRVTGMDGMVMIIEKTRKI